MFSKFCSHRERFRSENSFLTGFDIKNLAFGSTFFMSHPVKTNFLISTFPYLNKIWRTNSCSLQINRNTLVHLASYSSYFAGHVRQETKQKESFISSNRWCNIGICSVYSSLVAYLQDDKTKKYNLKYKYVSTYFKNSYSCYLAKFKLFSLQNQKPHKAEIKVAQDCCVWDLPKPSN